MKGQQLLLDVGNSRIKWRLQELPSASKKTTCTEDIQKEDKRKSNTRSRTGYRINQKHKTQQQLTNISHSTDQDMAPKLEGVGLEELLKQPLQGIAECRISQVNDETLEPLLSSLPKKTQVRYAKTQSQSQGLRNRYKNPKRLGVDRWLGMLGLWIQHPGASILVDAGTALTIEIIDHQGTHQGGYIMPGLGMQRSLLLNNTAHIEYQQSSETKNTKTLFKVIRLDPGRSSEECIDRGILLSQLTTIEYLLKTFSDYHLWFTGGDGALLAKALDCSENYLEHLVLDGLQYYSYR